MTVNLKKTTCQFFTLNRQPFSPQLVYNGMPVQQSDVSIYLGCALDNKLKWTKHAELVVSKARKRLSILKRLTGVKWGCNRDTLNTTYKTYIQPVLNYCNEVLISASENVRKLLDTFHNQVLRMITGGVKTTPVLAMQLLCDLQPFTNIIEKNAAILFNRLIRLPNNSFWRDYDSDGGRNLKTQKGFIQCVRENIQYKVINDVPFELLSFANPLDYAILDIRLDLVLNVRKRDLSPTALHAIALETINTRFPPEEWLHIYTDGSLLDFAQGAGIGVFSHLFSFYLHAGPLTTHFDASRVARDKPWSTLCKKSHGIPSSPRAAAVAKFRLLTGHDCLCAHLFRFNLVTSPICVLCDTGQDMTAAHLDECSALNDLNCIVKSSSVSIDNTAKSYNRSSPMEVLRYIHWCAKLKDEVEKLAYQLNEEAERTERPIRRLSKVMYGSTCADMQVDVMGECLSSIKHNVGTTSGCFYPRSNHWEVGGRPQCDKCGCRVRNCSQHRFTTLETISNYRNSYPGFSSGRPRGTTPVDVLQARRNRRQTAGEIVRHTTQATGRPISRFTVARRLHGGGLFARRPVRCVPLTPAHRRRRSLWCREHRNWRDNEWGRVLFTDESRFSLSSDSHRILIWRERGSRNHSSNVIERDRYGGRGVLVWGDIMLGSRTDLHNFDAGSVNGTRYCNEILLPYVRLFRGAMGLQFLFLDDNAPCHRTVAAEQLLESEDIERMDCPARSPDLNPIEHVWDFLGRRLTARTLPPVTIRELRLALQDEWAAMPQQLIDTLILSMADAVKPA
ncbi:transposable element Tcb2 transposase [Trichonephila clavipes]|nr:transposable element Tcb2 transposase [Trichonephila clavipes]